MGNIWCNTKVIDLIEFYGTERFPKRRHLKEKNGSFGSGNDVSEDRSDLELFLDGVYKNECKLQIEQEEITFIQTGIESLVGKIVQKVHKNISVKEFSGVKICEAEILKVGSFYEGTRNKFPDEFDFIYVFCECEQIPKGVELYCQFRYLLDEEFDKSFQPVCMFFQANQSLQYQSYTNKGLTFLNREKREILFCGNVKKHGPARHLQFVYHLPSGETKLIHVDLVPAVRVKAVSENDSDHKFWKEVQSLGKYLFVGSKISFTEAEVYIMKNILSKKHIKVYRILKNLINGHGDDEDLKKVLNKIRDKAFIETKGVILEGTTWSSYMIKCAVIEHHYECKNNHTENVGSCITEVLKRMGNSRHDCLRIFDHRDICIVDIIQSSIQGLLYSLHNELKQKMIRESVSRVCINLLFQISYHYWKNNEK